MFPKFFFAFQFLVVELLISLITKVVEIQVTRLIKLQSVQVAFFFFVFNFKNFVYKERHGNYLCSHLIDKFQQLKNPRLISLVNN